jgi:hypothetical protein
MQPADALCQSAADSVTPSATAHTPPHVTYFKCSKTEKERKRTLIVRAKITLIKEYFSKLKQNYNLIKPPQNIYQDI